MSTRHPRRRLTFAIALLALVSGGCGGAGADELSVRRDSAGITIVEHGGADRPLTVDFHEEFRIGGSDTRAGEAFFRVNSGTVGVDREGRIFVLDAAASRVEIFDDGGRHLRSAGRAGGGPGEMGMPFGLVVAPSGDFGVVDISKRALVRFDPQGGILPMRSFPPTYFGGMIRGMDPVMVVPVQMPGEGGAHVNALLRIEEEDTVVVVRVPQPDRRPISLTSCGMQFSGMAPLFAPALRWNAREDRVVLTAASGYRFSLFEGGREVKRVARAVEPERATEALAVAELGDGMRVRTERGEVVCDSREVVEQRGMAPLVPALGRLTLAPDGFVWVERGGVQGAARPIDLFAPDGEYRGTLPAGAPFPLDFLPDGRIVAAETDAYDVTRLVVYRMER